MSDTSIDVLGTPRGGRSRRRRATRAALAVITGLVLALTVLPGDAADAARKPKRVAKAGTNWVVQQQIIGSTVAVRVQWMKVKGAKSYEIDYVRSADGGQRLGSQIQRSKSKRTVRTRGGSGAVRSAWVGNLQPGQVYCFQVRGKNGRTKGSRGASHCKVTVAASRAPQAGASTMVVGTYNVCSAKCSRLLPWSTRRDLTLARIREMTDVPGGRGVDVLSIQEGLNAVDRGGSYDTALANTFAKGCLAPNRLEALYVRTSTYSIVPNTENGLTFGPGFNDETHGACWVRVRENATGREFVVVSVHLLPGEAADTDSIRERQMQTVVNAVTAAQPGQRIIYAGDFNSSRSRPYDGPAAVMAITGHQDGYDQALVYAAPPMMNSATGEDAPIRKSWMWGDHIDRVFAPPGVAVTTWRVDVRMANANTYATPLPSDHSPVVVNLQLPG